MSALVESNMSFWMQQGNQHTETYKLYINRLVFVETAEDPLQWMARVKKQWGYDQPIALRVINDTEYLGTTTPKLIESHQGWTGISWADETDAEVGIDISNVQGQMLVLEVVGGTNSVSSYGMGLINSAAIVAEKRQYAKYCVHLFPTQTAFDPETVFPLVEAEIRSSAWDGSYGDGFAPLEYNFGSVRVSTLDFYFPSFMLTGQGDYIVSSVICAMNMMENGALAMQLVPLQDALDYILVEPAQVITVNPQQRVYFSATWSFEELPCMKKLQMQLVVKGSQPPSAPIIINVHNSPPRPELTYTPYHYWLNTTCVTNRPFSLSRELPLVFTLLPVFRFFSDVHVAGLNSEDVIVAFSKDKGGNVLMRADGVPIVSGSCAGESESWTSPCFESSPWLHAGPNLWRMLSGETQFASDEPFFDFSQKTCQCTIHLGTIRGFPMVYEVLTGISPLFQVSVTVLDQQGWQVIKGETKPSYQSVSGTLRWDDQLVLQKWPGASANQFARLNLAEVRSRDGDDTPIGAALVSLYRLDHTRSQVGIQLAFYVYETYSLYDTLHSSSLLMKGAFITFSEITS